MPDSPLNQFQAFLEQHGQRLTRERRLVAETVFTLAPPFDAEAVRAAVRQSAPQPRVSSATVYRTLNLLEQSGLVSAQSPANTLPVYFHPFVPPQTGTLPSLCESTHSKLIAGTCPWCGRGIIHGKLRDDR